MSSPSEPPRNPFPNPVVPRLDTEITGSIDRGDRIYFERQKTGGLSLILCVASLAQFIVAACVFQLSPIASLICGIVGVCLLLIALATSSLCVSVDARQFRVSAGFFRVPLLRIELADLTLIQPEELRMLVDYGGWGIRYRHKTWAYIFRGSRGIRIHTRAGKQYVIGCDAPEKLAAILRAAASL